MPAHFLRNLTFYHCNACEQNEQTPCSAYLLFKEVHINWIHQLPEGIFSAKTVKVIFQGYYFWVSISTFCLLRQLELLTKMLETIFTIVIKSIVKYVSTNWEVLSSLPVCALSDRHQLGWISENVLQRGWQIKSSWLGGWEEQPKNTIKSLRVTQVCSMNNSSSHNY